MKRGIELHSRSFKSGARFVDELRWCFVGFQPSRVDLRTLMVIFLSHYVDRDSDVCGMEDGVMLLYLPVRSGSCDLAGTRVLCVSQFWIIQGQFFSRA